MFNLLLIGLITETAKVDIRQRAAFNAEQIPEGLRRLAESRAFWNHDCFDLQQG